VIDRVKADAPIWTVEVDGVERPRVEGTLPQAP
jgi:molybdopterin synthase catalytic subunit